MGLSAREAAEVAARGLQSRLSRGEHVTRAEIGCELTSYFSLRGPLRPYSAMNNSGIKMRE